MVEQKQQFSSQTNPSINVPITKTDPLKQPTLSSFNASEKVLPKSDTSMKDVIMEDKVFPTGKSNMKGNVIPSDTVVLPPVYGTGLSGDIGTSLPTAGKGVSGTTTKVPPAPISNTSKVIPTPPAPLVTSSMETKKSGTAVVTGVPQTSSSEEKTSKLGKIKSAIKSKLHKKRGENVEGAGSDTSSMSSASSDEGEGKSKTAKVALGIGSALGAATVAAGVVATGAVGIASAAVIGSAVSKKHKESKDVEAYNFVGSGNLPSTGVVSTGMGTVGSGTITSTVPTAGMGVTGTGLGTTTGLSSTSVNVPSTVTGVSYASVVGAKIGQGTSQNVLINPGTSSTTLPTNTSATIGNNKPLSDQYMGKFINK